MEINPDALKGAEILVRVCGQVNPENKVVVISDDSTEEVGIYLVEAAKKTTPNVKFIVSKQKGMHGAEPESHIADAMLYADIIFAATKMSMAHTEARRNATKKGAKYLSLPDYSIEQLSSPALDVDFLKIAETAEKIREILDNGKIIEIFTEKGTNLRLDISGRNANCCPGFCNIAGMLGSPPDIETNIAPVEEKSYGMLIADGSIPCKEIGLLKEYIAIKVDNGSIKEINTKNSQGKALEKLMELDIEPKKGVLAEFGIGLNPKAELCGRMLEDEGCLGTVHFGFGSNSTIGGKNRVNFHLDFVVRIPTVMVDKVKIMEGGKLLIS